MEQKSKVGFHFSTLFIVLMLVSYFLPWGTFLGQNLTAMEMPDIAAKINMAFADEESILPYSYIFYFPFIFTLITIITDIFFNKLQFIPLLLLFISLIVCSFYYLIICDSIWRTVGEPDGGPMQYVAFGFYFAWIAFLLAFIIEVTAAFIIPKFKANKSIVHL